MQLGTAVRPEHFSEHPYASILAREFNMVEAEDAMKWRTLRPAAGTYDFLQGDQVVEFARAHGMKVRGHCLVWGRDNPEWIAHGNFKSAELAQLLHEHIDRVMKHYAGDVFAWDVINEALDEKGDLRDSLWYNQPGIGLAGNAAQYIEQVFRWAHEADPQALLFYNEAEAEGINRKSDAIFSLLADFKRRGVPIDGVGLQMHLSAADDDNVSIAAGLSANIARLASLGLQVHITELDVSLPVDGLSRPTVADLTRQADAYRQIIRACLNNPGCTALQTWGFTDKYSWIGSHSRGTRGAALIFDRNYLPKPAYEALSRELAKSRPPRH